MEPQLLEAHGHDSLDGFRRESFPLGSTIEKVRELCATKLPVQVLHVHLPYQRAFRALPDPVPESSGGGPVGQSGFDVVGAFTAIGELRYRSRKVVPQSIAVVFPHGTERSVVVGLKRPEHQALCLEHSCSRTAGHARYQASEGLMGTGHF